MAKEDFCKRCSRYVGCGFISRNLQTKCDILQTFKEGYEQGYEDAINKACEWLDCYIDNYLFIDIENNVGIKWDDFINDFSKTMKGGKE